MENIDYENLKKRGFLKQRQEGYFILRTRMKRGIFRKEDLKELAEISEKYAKGFVHLSTRQGIEIPYIKYSDIEEVEKELISSSIQRGTSGTRFRTTTTCPGNNWCKVGLIDTFSLYDKIENKLNLKCGMDLPHKFKIVISGCPNTCTRAQVSEIGIHGQVDVQDPDKRIGYAVYLGGCGGRTPRTGFKLDKLFTEEETLDIIDKVVKFYKDRAKPRQRLALLIEELGRENFLRELGIY